MELIDTHCHLTMLSDEELAKVIERANSQSVGRMLCVGASDGAKSAPAAVKIAEQHSCVWASAGIHPHDAGEFSKIDEVSSLANHEKVVAIGETGLDFFRDWAPVDNQIKLFESTVELAKKVGKPLIIHCRDAVDQTLEILRSYQVEDIRGVFHCFYGDPELAKKIADLNFLVSVTGMLTFKKNDVLRETIREIPLEQIMLETDCPYMAPEPFRGSPSEPMHVYQIAETIAAVKGLTLEEVAKQTTQNAVSLFKLGTEF